MSARKAFLLGAIIGAGVLAAVGAVSAASGDSARTESSAETVPAGALKDLAHIDKLLTRLIADERKADGLDAGELVDRMTEIRKAKQQMMNAYFDQPVYGVAFSKVFAALDCLDSSVARGVGERIGGSLIKHDVIAETFAFGQSCKEKLESKLRSAQPPEVSIAESPTWTHNAAIGKSNICVNVETTPPQAYISASVTGPGNYTASLPKSALHTDGSAQVGTTITQPGSYTVDLTVYDKKSNETATSASTVDVAPPPQNGPTPKFGPACPKPTQ